MEKEKIGIICNLDLNSSIAFIFPGPETSPETIVTGTSMPASDSLFSAHLPAIDVIKLKALRSVIMETYVLSP